MDTSISEFGLGRLAAAQYSSRFQMMAKTMGISSEQIGKANEFISGKIQGNERAYSELGDSVADMSINLTKLSADMASLYNQDYASVAEDMQSILTGQTKPLRKFGVDISVAGMKAFALKNGLDADIQSMSQAEKSLLRYQMVMTQASGSMGDFQKTADTWANSMRTVKQLLQEFARILGEAFIQAFKPALIAFRNFMSNLLTLTQSALNAVGKLLGWEKIDFGGATLTEDMEGYADALDDASGNAKKLKGQLRGIDELNNLTTNPKGGGGGGGDTLGNITGADLWENIKETKEKYESTVKDWFDFGRRIADTIEDSLKNIDWEKIKKSVSTGATNFASFLNGLFKPTMFYAIGGTIAEGINTGLTAAYSFGKEFDFENFGVSVREGIKGFLETFDWELLGETINTWVHGFFDFCKGLFGDKQLWKDMFDAAVKLAGSIDIETISILAGAITIINTSTWLRNALTNAFMSAMGTSALSLPAIAVAFAGGLIIGNGVGQIVTYLNGDTEGYNEYAQMNPFTNGSWLDNFISVNLEEELSGGGTWGGTKFYKKVGEFGEKIGEIIGKGIVISLNAQDLESKIYEAFESHFKTIMYSLKSFFYMSSTSSSFANVPDSVKKQLGLTEANHVGFDDVIDNFVDLGKDIVRGILKGMTDESGNISLKALFDNFVKGLKKIFDIHSPSDKKEIKDIGKNIVLGVINGFDLVDFYTEMTDWWNTNVEPWFTVERWLGIANNIKTAISTKWNEIKTQWVTNITNWWTNNVAPWFTLDKWKGVADGIRAGIVAKWNEVVLWFAGAVGNIVTKAKNTLTYSEFYSIGESIGKGLKTAFETFINSMTTLWDNLKKLVSGGLSMTIKMNADASGVTDTLNAMGDLGNAASEAIAAAILKAQEDAGKDDKKDPPGSPKTTTTYETKKGNNGYVYTVKKYATGGFPDIGSLALIGETVGQTEILGNINGRTGVVGGEEITGIRDAIVNTSNAEMQLLRQQNTLLQGILAKEFGISSNDLFTSVRNSANDYLLRTGNPAF